MSTLGGNTQGVTEKLKILYWVEEKDLKSNSWVHLDKETDDMLETLVNTIEREARLFGKDVRIGTDGRSKMLLTRTRGVGITFFLTISGSGIRARGEELVHEGFIKSCARSVLSKSVRRISLEVTSAE